jgi:hypothetical protein
VSTVEGPLVPALGCALTHWYQLRLPGEKIGSVNNRRLVAIASQHKLARRQGLDALRGAVMGSVKGERAFEAVLLPVGAALFPDILPLKVVLRSIQEGTLELRSAAIFAALYYPSSDLSVELAEQTITGKGDRLILQAIGEVLDLRGREGKCRRCGRAWVRAQTSMDWVPHRTM